MGSCCGICRTFYTLRSRLVRWLCPTLERKSSSDGAPMKVGSVNSKSNGEQMVNQRSNGHILLRSQSSEPASKHNTPAKRKGREKDVGCRFLFRDGRSAMLVAQLCHPGLEVRHNRCSGVVPTDVYWPASHETRSAKLDASSV